MSDGRISFRIRSEVSELSDQGAVRLLAGNNNTVTVPSLTVPLTVARGASSSDRSRANRPCASARKRRSTVCGRYP